MAIRMGNLGLIPQVREAGPLQDVDDIGEQELLSPVWGCLLDRLGKCVAPQPLDEPDGGCKAPQLAFLISLRDKCQNLARRFDRQIEHDEDVQEYIDGIGPSTGRTASTVIGPFGPGMKNLSSLLVGNFGFG